MRVAISLLRVACCAALVACGDAAAADRNKQILAEATDRWRGSTCQLRQAFEITNDRAGGNASASRWYLFKPEGDRGLHYRIRFTPRDAVQPALVRQNLMPGTALVFGEWTTDRAGAGTAVAVRLRFADLPADAQLDFLPAVGFSLDPKRLPDVERFVRIELCQVARPAEAAPPIPARLTAPAALAAESAGVSARATATIGPAPAAPAATGYQPKVTVVATAVTPPRGAPGGEFELVLSYRVDGLPAGTAFDTREQRVILAGERELAKFEDRFDRGNDTYVSTRRIRAPADVVRGVLTFRGTVRLAGLESTGEALFEVR